MPLPDVIAGRSQESDTESGLVAVRYFTVTAASEADARAKLLAATGIQRGVVYTSPYGESPDPACVCREVVTRPRVQPPAGGTGLIDVTAQYSHRDAGQYGGGALLPLPGGPAVWLPQAVQTAEPYDVDRDGLAVENAVGEPIDPPLTRLSSNSSFVAKWFVDEPLGLVPLWTRLVAFKNHTNSGPFQGAPAESFLITDVQVDPHDDALFLVSILFEYRPPQVVTNRLTTNAADGEKTIPGWRDVRINAGFRRWVDSGPGGEPIYESIVDAANVPISRPALLDETGAVVLAPGTPPYLAVFRPHPTADYSAIGIPGASP